MTVACTHYCASHSPYAHYSMCTVELQRAALVLQQVEGQRPLHCKRHILRSDLIATVCVLMFCCPIPHHSHAIPLCQRTQQPFISDAVCVGAIRATWLPKVRHERYVQAVPHPGLLNPHPALFVLHHSACGNKRSQGMASLRAGLSGVTHTVDPTSTQTVHFA